MNVSPQTTAVGIFAAIAEARSLCGPILKEKVRGLGYSITSAKAVMATVTPPLESVGLVVSPVGVEVLDRSDYSTKSGAAMSRLIVSATYRWTAVKDGSTFDSVVIAEACDSSDKAAAKCMTSALKTTLQQVLLLEFDDEIRVASRRLPCLTACRSVVGNGGGHDQHVTPGKHGTEQGLEVRRRCEAHCIHFVRRRHCPRAEKERDVPVLLTSGLGQGDTHPAAGTIADITNVVDCFVCRPGRDEHRALYGHWDQPRADIARPASDQSLVVWRAAPEGDERRPP